MRLTPLHWGSPANTAAGARILDALGATEGNVRVVGGAVRDALANLPTHDIDLATIFTPSEVMARLESIDVKVIPTGIAHGTVTVVLPTSHVEITTLRRDVATDGRRAIIAYTDDWREDAARRDFTINALSMDPLTGQIYDYFGGQDDLAAGRVAFIGDPLTRIAEDHLRILRFFRFHARFDRSAPDAAAIAACAARANDLMALSRERIADELLKLLSLPTPAATVALMIAHGIFTPILPEIVSAAELTALIGYEEANNSKPSALRRMAALLPADPDRADAIGARLKFSKVQRKTLVSLAARHPSDSNNARALAYRVGLRAATDRLLLLGAPLTPMLDWVPPRFSLTGGDLIARGLAPGPQVAEVLREVENAWIESGFPDRAISERLAQAAVTKALHGNESTSAP